MREIHKLPAEILEHQTGNSDRSLEPIDVAAILQASQAISGEMITDNLVARLMSILVADTGAERALLLCPGENGWRADAVGMIDGNKISVDMSLRVGELHQWSADAVNFVRDTGETLVSENAQHDKRLNEDLYIRKHAVKSVLCVPIVQRQDMAAILYLENNLTTNAFTAGRVLVARALASQAAIALQNARLYSEVVKEVGERRRAESALRAITSGTAAVTGKDFFRSLVQSLADSLQVKCVFVAECVDSGNRRVRTLAFIQDGMFEDNIEYELSGTPCERLVEGATCYIPENLEKLYPIEEGFESYLGAPALDQSGRLIGHLAIRDTGSMDHLPHAESILRIFAARVGVELQRKRTEEALQASEEKYRLLVENQTDLVVKLDREGRLQFVSPAYCEKFARQENELLGTLFHAQTHAGDLERVGQDWQKLLACPWVTQFEHRARTAAGVRWLGWSLRALRDDAGGVMEIVGVGRDVTDRRKAEEQARQNLHTLAHAGRLQSMGEMASSLAHELNQPLTSILSFSQASQRVINNDDYDHNELLFALERIAANAKRAGDIIGHMRGFIRKGEPQTRISNINSLICEAMDLVNSELVHLEIDAEFDLAKHLPDVLVDPVQIQQVILSLVRSSMEAIVSHAVDERRIVISTRMGRPGQVEVRVTDSDPGMDRDIADNVFDAFATSKSAGMDMSLSICKSIVEAHAGELTIRHAPGGGATFSFLLPANSGGGDV